MFFNFTAFNKLKKYNCSIKDYILTIFIIENKKIVNKKIKIIDIESIDLNNSILSLFGFGYLIIKTKNKEHILFVKDYIYVYKKINHLINIIKEDILLKRTNS